MDTKILKTKNEFRKQKLSESFISQAIPDYYHEKCGQFLYPLIAFDSPKSLKTNISQYPQPNVNRSIHGTEVWTYKKFEKKLSDGVLAIPKLNLENVPKSIFGFVPSLRIIYLNDNALKQLPVNFFDDLPTLAWVDLRNNQLRTLPDLTKPHEGLRSLLLQYNQISTLPYSLCRANNLNSILLRGNPIIDPPPHILQSGTSSIITYFTYKMDNPENSSDESSDSEIDEDMRLFNPDLRHQNPPASTILRKISNRVIGKSISAGNSDIDLMATMSSTKDLPKCNTLKTLYSDGLWRNASYDGAKPLVILAKAQEEMRRSVDRKLAVQKEEILQRLKDKDTVVNFRNNARELQYKGVGKKKAEVYQGLVAPFGTLKNEQKSETLNLDDFHKEFIGCWERLNDLTATPAPLDDFEGVKKRLSEVESIHRKIANMKLSMKIPV